MRPYFSKQSARTSFSRSYNIAINDGNLAASATSVNKDTGIQGLELLRKEVQLGALYNAATGHDPPRCHPRTREAILREILNWIRSPKSQRRFIMWITGPAGAGKTAIAQTIAEICAAEGLLAASFFFSRTASGRNTSALLIPTISYQLAQAMPALQSFISRAVERDPMIFSQSLASQMKELIVKPIKDAHAHGIALDIDGKFPQVVILDGFDECGREHEQHEILDVIESFHTELEEVPLIFLVASRPDFGIRVKFSQSNMASITHRLVLDGTYFPHDDIRIYLEDMFAEISHTHIRGPYLPQPWPTDAQMAYLVEQSSGQFIYAATVVKYIRSPRHDPSMRLNVILALTQYPENDKPFAQLDALYTHVLSCVEDLRQVLDILNLILIKDQQLLRHLWECDSGNARAALIDMHALVHVPGTASDKGLPTLYHASLEDFLTDQSRSGVFFIDTRKGHSMVAAFLIKRATSLDSLDEESPDHQEDVKLFNYHFKRGLITKEPSGTLEPINFPVFLSKCMGRLDGLDITEFFECMEKSVSVEFRESLEQQYIAWLLDTIYQYPEPFRSSFLTFICSPFSQSPTYPHHYTHDILQIFLRSLNMPESDYRDFLKFDRNHLSLTYGCSDAYGPRYMYRVAKIILNSTGSAKYTFTRDKSVAFVRQIIEFLTGCTCQTIKVLRLKDKGGYIRIEDTELDPNRCMRLYYSCLKFFRNILRFSYKDAELVLLLQSSIPRWTSNESPLSKEARQNLTQYSLEYIERCKALPDDSEDESEIDIKDLDQTSSAQYRDTDNSESEGTGSESHVDVEKITSVQSNKSPPDYDQFIPHTGRSQANKIEEQSSHISKHHSTHIIVRNVDSAVSEAHVERSNQDEDSGAHDYVSTSWTGGLAHPVKHLLEEDGVDYDADSEEDHEELALTGTYVSKNEKKRRRRGD